MHNILIISYYWPPSGGGGVQRWLKFTKYLPEFGVNPIVFTPENPTFAFRDESLLSDVGEELEVIKFPIWEPYKLLPGKSKPSKKSGQAFDNENRTLLQELIVWARGNMIVPDPRVFWVRPSVKFLTTWLKDRNIDMIITTGPPHSMHLIGKKLKKKTGIPWIADFRDPWSEWHQLRHLKVSKPVLKVHRHLEKTIFKNANAVITVSPGMADDLTRLGSKNVKVVSNGFDHEDIPTSLNQLKPDKFLISYVGTIDDLRDPKPFLKALKMWLDENPERLEETEMRIHGIISESFFGGMLKDKMLSEVVKIGEYLSHDQVFNLVGKSAALLLLLSKFGNSKGFLTGKLFEYIASGRPILGVIDDTGDAADLIRTGKYGWVADPDDILSIKLNIEKAYQEYKQQKNNYEIRIDSPYSRKNLSKKLSEIIDEELVKVKS
ncbi:glycosyltransferase family 4 protein [Marinigracilibium pacificum]|uniref:Glycosyltransferase family 4 protein n=1 Tax=Marinigracilibium pacificum TaxID=2729599 RepID=A0A848IX97_9BACT|nr:glycosyltransferase family 4 protein [Marinigracilibium pacificum]NMM49153.1 glycosyltransferase family 4 protein [Marinigracilibium pacificum]